MSNVLALVWAWAVAHQALILALAWPVLTAALTALLRKRTPEELAAMAPGWRAAYKLVTALGIDAPKVLEAFRELLAKAGPPGGAALILVGTMALGVAGVVSGCGLIPAKDVPAVENVALDVEQLACVLAADDMGTSEPAAIATICNIPPSAIAAIVNALSAKHKASAEVARAKLRDALCTTHDAGADR